MTAAISPSSATLGVPTPSPHEPSDAPVAQWLDSAEVAADAGQAMERDLQHTLEKLRHGLATDASVTARLGLAGLIPLVPVGDTGLLALDVTFSAEDAVRLGLTRPRAGRFYLDENGTLWTGPLVSPWGSDNLSWLWSSGTGSTRSASQHDSVPHEALVGAALILVGAVVGMMRSADLPSSTGILAGIGTFVAPTAILPTVGVSLLVGVQLLAKRYRQATARQVISAGGGGGWAPLPLSDRPAEGLEVLHRLQHRLAALRDLGSAAMRALQDRVAE